MKIIAEKFASLGKYKPEIEDWLIKKNYFNGCGRYHGTEILMSIKERFGEICQDYDTRSEERRGGKEC